MSDSSGLLLVGAVAAVGVLHTIVPDHWVPITLIARQRGWSKAATARVALKAGAGHVLSTLAIALVIWIGGVAVATRFGYWVDTIASVALIGFGAWIAIGAWRDLRSATPTGMAIPTISRTCKGRARFMVRSFKRSILNMVRSNCPSSRPESPARAPWSPCAPRSQMTQIDSRY
jgi:glycerol-3-phosphate acyltransferase PlsY